MLTNLQKEKNESLGFSIRLAEDQEIDKIINLRAIDQSRVGVFDYRAYKKFNHYELCVGISQGQLIGSLGFVKHNKSLAYLGVYFVIKEHRGKGYGLRIWNQIFNKIEAQNIALNGVVSQQEKYKKYEFKTESKGIRYIFKGNNSNYESEFLQQCKEVDFELLKNYDRHNFPTDRQQFLKSWINLPRSKALAFVKDNKIQGYGVLRLAEPGYKIGPLFADNYEVASTILKKLISQAPQQSEIILDTPQPHEDILRLAEEFKMTNLAFYVRMFTNGEPQIFKKKSIYGITSSEFG